jgi:hypothetical protein
LGLLRVVVMVVVVIAYVVIGGCAAAVITMVVGKHGASDQLLKTKDYYQIIEL